MMQKNIGAVVEDLINLKDHNELNRADRETIELACNLLDEYSDLLRKQSLTVHIQTPPERTRAQVMATGNKWAIENFNATH